MVRISYNCCEVNEMEQLYREILGKINTLPPLSVVVQRLSALLRQPDIPIAEIVATLQSDPVLAARVLRLANSAYIGLPRTVSSLQNAVVLLGLQRIHSLVLISSVITLGKKQRNERSFDVRRFWSHSIAAAVTAESIVLRSQRYDLLDAGDLFSAALLHDIGKLILALFASDHLDAAYREAIDAGEPVYRHEHGMIAHTKIGFDVARMWNFPDCLCQSILFHHDPASSQNFAKHAALTHIADVLAHTIGRNSVVDEAPPSMMPEALAYLSLEVEQLRVIAAESNDKLKDIDQLYES